MFPAKNPDILLLYIHLWFWDFPFIWWVNLKFNLKHLNVISNNVSEILNTSLLMKTLKFRKDFFRVILIIPWTIAALNEMEFRSRDFPDCLTWGSLAGYPLISLILVNRFRVWFDLDFAHYLQELNIKQCRMGLAHGAWGVCGAQGQSGYLSPSRAGGCILTVEIFQATAPVSGDEVSVQPNWALRHTFLHGEVLFECKAPAFVSTGSVYLKNGMCPAPWKGWDVCRSQPLLYQALSMATMLSAGENHILGGFCKAFSVSMGACHGGCMSLALWVFIPATPGLSLHPNPLGEHGCFSIFQGWELSTPVETGAGSQLWQVEVLLLSQHCRCGKDMVQARVSYPGQEDTSS